MFIQQQPRYSGGVDRRMTVSEEHEEIEKGETGMINFDTKANRRSHLHVLRLHHSGRINDMCERRHSERYMSYRTSMFDIASLPKHGSQSLSACWHFPTHPLSAVIKPCRSFHDTLAVSTVTLFASYSSSSWYKYHVFYTSLPSFIQINDHNSFNASKKKQ